MELEKIKSEINRVGRELDEMSEQFSIYYKQIEQQLRREARRKEVLLELRKRLLKERGESNGERT